jgi:hypothetical protein
MEWQIQGICLILVKCWLLIYTVDSNVRCNIIKFLKKKKKLIVCFVFKDNDLKKYFFKKKTINYIFYN